jgi:hypothetical protein
MILPFSLQLNGEHTLFVEKITQGLLEYEPTKQLMLDYEWPKNHFYSHPFSCRSDLKPKLHTMREDAKERWKPGNSIHMVVNNRSPKMWQFAPIIPCTRTQCVDIFWFGTTVIIHIDEKPFVDFNTAWNWELQRDIENLKKLAYNDGFETPDAFLKYFCKDFKGKIIHWTNLKY